MAAGGAAGRRDAATWLMGRVPVFYGWVIVAVGGLGVFFGGPGQSSVIAALTEPALAELGLGRSAVAAAFTVGTLAAALAMAPVGRLTDRFGGQPVLAVGALLLGLTCLLMAGVGGVLGMTAGFAALRLLVQGPLTLTSTTMVAQWFVRGRGRAQSVMALGMTAGFAIYPPLTQYLIDTLGWRMAWVAIGLLTWLLLPPVLLLVRSRPEALGLRPDGVMSDESKVMGDDTNGSPVPVPGRLVPPHHSSLITHHPVDWTAGQATRTPTFWLLASSIAVTWLAGAGLNFHQFGILLHYGLNAQVAALIFTVAGVASVPATLAAGWLIDRVPARRLLVGMLLVQTAAAWWMLVAGTPATAVVYGALNGLLIGGSNVVNAVVFAAYYGRRHLGSIRGVTMIVNVGASALGPLPLGLARDLLGGYEAALIGLGLLPLLFALAMRWVGPPGPPPAPHLA